MADYTRLAALIGTHQEMALFRRFATLNAKNLLYMQSELVHLEGELANIALEDGCSGDGDKALFQVSLFDLKESSGTSKDLQWRKVLEVREKLKAYSTFRTPRFAERKLTQSCLLFQMMLFYNTLRFKSSRDQITRT